MLQSESVSSSAELENSLLTTTTFSAWAIPARIKSSKLTNQGNYIRYMIWNKFIKKLVIFVKLALFKKNQVKYGKLQSKKKQQELLNASKINKSEKEPGNLSWKRWKRVPVDGAEHPVNVREVGHGIEESHVGFALEKQDDGIEQGLWSKVSSQRDDKVVDARRGVISCQDDDFVGPVVFFGATVAAVLANLKEVMSAVSFRVLHFVTQINQP